MLPREEGRPAWHRAVPAGLAVVLFIASALGVRLHRIAQPPFDFHPTRQFHAAIIARSLDLLERADTPAWQRAIAETNLSREPILEPPLLEHVAIAGSRVLHGDYLLLVRVLSALSWLLGAVPLFAVARRSVGAFAAALVAAVYLALPFGVLASRSFQPDPLMVSLSLVALWAIVRHDEEPGPRAFAWAVGAAAAATFIKPPGAFLLLAGAFLSLALARHGGRRAFLRADVLGFLGLTPLPALLYVAHGFFVTGSLHTQTRNLFALRWLGDPLFWHGWLEMQDRVLGVAVLSAAILGVALAEGRLRALLVGLWSGFIAFAFVFPYHIHTHDYYHLPSIPIAALSLAPLFERMNRPVGFARIAVPLAVLPLLLRAGRMVDAAPDPTRRVSALKAVGAQIGPTDRAVSLSDDYGLSLAYLGEVSSLTWPTRGDMGFARSHGQPLAVAPELLQQMIREQGMEFFVVLDQAELEAQPELVSALRAYPVRAKGEEYAIYDLRAR